MLQFMRFDNTNITETTFSILSGGNLVRFVAKRVLALILFPYSTIFVAVAVPFLKTPCIPIYFIGAFLTVIYILRFSSDMAKLAQYKGGSIHITPDFIEVKKSSSVVRVPSREITYLERNILGNLIIRDKITNTVFPIGLLSPDDRAAVIAMFKDMAPNRTLLIRKLWEIGDAIVVALVLAVHINQYVLQAYFIPTSSMEDTLKVNDHLFVEKITYGPMIPQMIGMSKPIHLGLGIRSVQRGDIVIFRPPHEQDKDYIKRCIALPGDRFEIKNGKVYLNGDAQKKPYIKGITDFFNSSIGQKKAIEGVVPKGKIIVMGDNRENSSDSRVFGYLDIERVKGKALVLYWNTGQIKNLDFSRFGLIK